MSQSANTTSRDASPDSLGARENFFDSSSNDYETEETLTGPRPTDIDRDWGPRHTFNTGATKVEYVAHGILRQNGSATMWCPVCLFGDEDDCDDHDGKAVKLSDPELHVPKEFPEGFAPRESAQYRLRRRYCEEDGHVTFGGKLANKTTDEFLECVDEMLDWVVAREDTALDVETADDIRSGARDMKMDGRKDDEEIMREVVADVLDEIGEVC